MLTSSQVMGAKHCWSSSWCILMHSAHGMLLGVHLCQRSIASGVTCAQQVTCSSRQAAGLMRSSCHLWSAPNTKAVPVTCFPHN